MMEENFNLPLKLPDEMRQKCKTYMKMPMDKSVAVKLGPCLRHDYTIDYEDGMAIIYYLPDWVT